MYQNGPMWDRIVPYGTEASHVGQKCTIWWYRKESSGKEQYLIGQSSPLRERTVHFRIEQSLLGQSCPFWDRAVPSGTEQSLVGQSSPFWDIPIPHGTEKYLVEQSSTF